MNKFNASETWVGFLVANLQSVAGTTRRHPAGRPQAKHTERRLQALTRDDARNVNDSSATSATLTKHVTWVTNYSRFPEAVPKETFRRAAVHNKKIHCNGREESKYSSIQRGKN